MLKSTTRTLLEASRKTCARSRDLVADAQVKTRQSEEIIARSKELLTYSRSLAHSRSALDLPQKPVGLSLSIPNHLSSRRTEGVPRSASGRLRCIFLRLLSVGAFVISAAACSKLIAALFVRGL
jgi:hypothetical protein